MRNGPVHASPIARCPTVRGYLEKAPVSVCDQAPGDFAAGKGGSRGTKYHPHKVVVEERGADHHLGLFQRDASVHAPWSLPESSKGDRVPFTDLTIGLSGPMNLRIKLRRKKSTLPILGLEGDHTAQNFAPENSCEPDRCNPPRLVIQIQVGGVSNIHG